MPTMFLSEVVPYAINLVRDSIYQMKRSEKEFRKGDEEKSFSRLLFAADQLERAARHLRGYLDQAAYSLNTRPRQTLGGMTPSDKLAETMQ